MRRGFCLGRGTKQGDPLSTLLFNAVLEAVFRDVRSKWEEHKYGIDMSIGLENRLTSLCFADDVLLLATNMKELKVMMQDLIEAAARRGLVAHDDKTKVLTNADITAARRLPASLEFGGRSFQVLCSSESVRWLGRKVSFDDPCEVDLNNRIAAAWGAFTGHKDKLTCRKFRLVDRLKLFNAVVSSTVLYGCETWTLKLQQQRRLRSVQRRMLRMVLNAKRQTLDPTSSQSVSDSGNEEVDLLEPWPD